MKKIISIICFALLITAGPAFASSWSLTPTGPVDTSAGAAGDALDVALFLDYTGDVSGYSAGIDLDFQIDLAEVTPILLKSGDADITWSLGTFATISAKVVGDILTVAGGQLSGYATLAAGLQNVAVIHMELVNPNGLQDGDDMALLAQTGLKGIANYDATVVVGLNAAAGPDVGAPGGGPVIPIPGAVYLLLSGLVGIIGLRRKMS